MGQPIFVVAATSHLAARKAVRLARIQYRELPALLTIDEALAANSRYEEGPRIYGRGDTSAAIAAAPLTIEGRFEIGGQEHFYLEGQAALALPQEGGDMVVHSSSQHPTEIQHKVAEAIGKPMNAVRVEVRRMGGGFGGKESQGNALACACAVVAALTGRPAKMRYDRDDDMVITGKRHDFRIDYRAGVDRDGRLLGVEFDPVRPLRLEPRPLAPRRGPRDAPRRQRLLDLRRSGSKATASAPTPSRTPPSAASAARRGWSGSSG